MDGGPVLLIGSPRSGTTWLGKIFDSHPDVIYRHEPDSLPDPYGIPFLPDRCDDQEILDRSRRYIRSLAGCRKLRAVGGRPYFAKRYRNGFLDAAFRAGIFSLKGLDRIMPMLGLDRMSLPSFLYPQRPDTRMTVVIKSVSSLGRIGLFAAACPDMPIIYIIRHPCGYVASRLRGVKLNVMSDAAYERDLCRQMPEARQLGWSLEDVADFSPAERFAFSWSLLNERAMRVAEGSARIHTVFYEDLCINPQAEAERMFAFTGLEMSAQSKAFIAESMGAKNDNGFYSIHKNSKAQIDKWKEELSPAEIARIMDVVTRSRPGKIYEKKIPIDCSK